MAEDKRENKRVMQKCTLSYKVRSDAQYKMSQVENYSKGGLGFISETEYAVGDVLEFSVRFPFFFKRIIVDAKIVNVRQEGQKFNIGVAFLNMPADVLSMLDEYLQAMGL